MNIAVTGLNEAAALEAGFNVACAWGTFIDKAEFFPGAENLFLKLVFDKGTGRLLGLEGYGQGEVVKRVDVFSALLKNQGRVVDLLDMEFAYAPPYAPAVDPLYSLGCAARNSVLEGVEGLKPSADLEDRLVIDVRDSGETEAKPFPEGEVINISFVELRERWQEIPKDRPLLVICSKGPRSAESLRIIKEKGFPNAIYLGGGSLMRPAAD